jgi:hypothetical protein
MDDIDSVREADPVISEALLEDTRTQWEIDVEEAICRSMEDIESQNTEQDLYEKELLSHFNQQKQERAAKVDPVLAVLERLARVDSKTKYLLDFMEPILFSFKEGAIDHWFLDKETYLSIFQSLKSIRFRDEERKFLQEFIQETNE